MEILSERLTALRGARRLSRKEVSQQLHLAERTYQRYEAGEREPTASVLAELARFYQVTADYLLGLTDERD